MVYSQTWEGVSNSKKSAPTYRLVQKKGTVLLSTSLAWPAVAGCSRAEAFSQLSSISFAQPCRSFGCTVYTQGCSTDRYSMYSGDGWYSIIPTIYFTLLDFATQIKSVVRFRISARSVTERFTELISHVAWIAWVATNPQVCNSDSGSDSTRRADR